jgi:hypothetical protein
MEAEFLICQSRGNYFLVARFFLAAVLLAAGFFFAEAFLAVRFFFAGAFFLPANFYSSCSVCLASDRINFRSPLSASVACF